MYFNLIVIILNKYIIDKKKEKEQAQEQTMCETCHNKVFSYEKYCRKCASYNRHYDPYYNNINSKLKKRSEPTKYALQLAKALYSMNIEIELEPEIWYTSCNFYTPDILLNDEFIIIEVDGPIHEKVLQIQKNDRIRQRALENSGYYVYRIKNKEIVDSLEHVVAKIRSIILSKHREKQQQKQQQQQTNDITIQTRTRMVEIDVPEIQRMSNVSEAFIKAYAAALNSTLITIEKWNGPYFKEFLSQYNPTPIDNRCAMEKVIFVLLGLNLRLKNDITGDDERHHAIIDFEHYSKLFDKCIGIMNYLFGKIGEIELQNAFNITATNFIKNLIFYGKPRIAHNRLVLIKDYKSILSHINNFNKYFYRFGIIVEEAEVKVECLGELEKIKGSIEEKKKAEPSSNSINSYETISNIEMKHFGWLDRWLEEAKSFQWIDEWLGYKNLNNNI